MIPFCSHVDGAVIPRIFDTLRLSWLVLNIMLYRSGYLPVRIVGLVFGFAFREWEKNLGFGGCEIPLVVL